MLKMNNVLEMLERRVKEYPHNIFVEDSTEQCTYIEAYDWARRIGSNLPETESRAVVLLADKSVRSVLFLLSAIYAGKFYVFINPTSPEERIAQMLDVSKAEILFVDSANAEKAEKFKNQITIISMENMMNDNFSVDEKRLEEIRKTMKPSDLLYGMFTSGTTGIPKLVTVSHVGVIHFIEDFVKETGIDDNAIIGNQAPFDFDVSVKDLYSTLYTGGKLVIINKQLFTRPDDLMSCIMEHRINTLIWAVTALCLAAGVNKFEENVYKGIKKVIFSGEVMPMRYLRIWHNALPECEFVNVYGPTEVVCNCTLYRIKDEDMEKEKIPIGIPFPKRNIYLLDDENREWEAVGKIAEICVGGETLATGYFNNDEETKKKFVKYRNMTGEEDFIYHTGDLGYYGEDGVLYFVGRKDFQIKRMGHRIELEEIDRSLYQMFGVEMVCSIYDEESQKLCTFYTGIAEATEIRKKLRARLPIYMLPNRIVQIKKIPVNKNGKIDRKKLRLEYEQYFR